MKIIVAFVIVVSSLFASCNFIGGKRVEGNGNIKTEDRSVSSFNKVDVSGSMKINISQGDVRKVKIEADENLMSLIEVKEEGDRLIVKSKDGYNLSPSHDINVYVTAPLYKSIEVSGACDIIGQTKINNSEKLHLEVSGAGDIKMDVNAPALEVQISGSGTVSLKGETKSFDMDLTGAANAHCFDLLSEETKVEISGAGDAEVYASVKLNAQVSGAGTVSYKGDAKEINQNVSGAGSVKKK